MQLSEPKNQEKHNWIWPHMRTRKSTQYHILNTMNDDESSQTRFCRHCTKGIQHLQWTSRLLDEYGKERTQRQTHDTSDSRLRRRAEESPPTKPPQILAHERKKPSLSQTKDDAAAPVTSARDMNNTRALPLNNPKTQCIIQ